MTTATAPTADRPIIPKDYGIPASTEGLLDWAHLDQRLRDAPIYWIATASLEGVPRVRPIDGLWHDGILYVGGSPATRWVRDIQANPNVSIHLDDGWDVVILEGEAEVLAHGVDRRTAEALAAQSQAKYPQYGMTVESYTGPGPIAIRPRRAYGWTSFPSDVTRFRFER